MWMWAVSTASGHSSSSAESAESCCAAALVFDCCRSSSALQQPVWSVECGDRRFTRVRESDNDNFICSLVARRRQLCSVLCCKIYNPAAALHSPLQPNKVFVRMCWKGTNKSNVRVLFAWVMFLSVFYIFLGPETREEVSPTTSEHGVQSIVFIAMGKLAKESIVDGAIASLREVGKWDGMIHVITDRESCFVSARRDRNAVILTTEPVDSIVKIKSMKARLFEFLPREIKSILYMDVDILVTKNLNLFLYDLRQQALARSSPPDFGMFLDSGGHFFGVCSGCDKWHTGIIWMQRDVGVECMQAWENILLSGKYETDQESIDEAERSNYCPNALAFSSKHLLFAKDYFAMFFSPSRTFVHLTAISRLESQDFFYRKFIVPSVRSSLKNSGLSIRQEDETKEC